MVRREGESEEEYEKRIEEARAAIQARMLTLVHALVQAALAAGLLQVLPLKPRTVGLLGVIASAMNCYFLYPAYPKPAPQVKSKVA